MELYFHRYFDHYQKGSLRSAEVIVLIVLDMIRPSSVVDVGCGVGAWLSVSRFLLYVQALPYVLFKLLRRIWG